MLKQKSSEYRGYRTAGIRMREEMLPQLGQLYGSRTRAMQPAVHAFDKAHTVMLVEEDLLPHALDGWANGCNTCTQAVEFPIRYPPEFLYAMSKKVGGFKPMPDRAINLVGVTVSQ